jgi:hypothetical protein
LGSRQLMILTPWPLLLTPHLLKLGHIKPVAGDGFGIRVVFFDRLLHQATVLSAEALGAPALHRTPNEPRGVTMKVSDTPPTNGAGTAPIRRITPSCSGHYPSGRKLAKGLTYVLFRLMRITELAKRSCSLI